MRHLAKLAEIHQGEEGITVFLPLYFGSELKVPLCNAELCCPILSDSLWPHGLEPASLLCPWRFSRQEYWCVLLCPPPGDLPNPGIEPRSPALQADSLPSEPPGKPKGAVNLRLSFGLTLPVSPQGPNLGLSLPQLPRDLLEVYRGMLLIPVLCMAFKWRPQTICGPWYLCVVYDSYRTASIWFIRMQIMEGHP